jgi:hypothetical protein
VADNNTVAFTVESLGEFKKAYNKAVSDGVETFWFEGNEYVPGYAKYLIEYLEQQFYSPLDRH